MRHVAAELENLNLSITHGYQWRMTTSELNIEWLYIFHNDMLILYLQEKYFMYGLVTLRLL